MAESVKVISAEQFQHLTDLYTRTADRQSALQLLTQAATAIDRCDGAQPGHVRTWIRAIDGWATEKDIQQSFLIDLCKQTTSADLLDEIRRLTNPPSSLTTWSTLRAELVDW